MKRIAPLLLTFALLFSACGQAGTVPTTVTSTEAQSTTEAPTTTEVPTTIEPLPGNCRLLKGDAQHATEYFADQVYWLRGDLTRLSATKELFTRSADEGSPQLLLRDEVTGEEIVIAAGASLGAPSVQFIIDERYIVWTDNFKDNGFGGIYDTKRMVNISWGEGVFPLQLHENTLWFMATCFHYGGRLSLYRVSLDGLDKMKKINLGENLLEGIPEADLDCRRDVQWVALSPDCHYYAARGAAIGIYVFDLQKKTLALQVSAGAIPTSGDSWDSLHYLDFKDSKTLCCYGDEPYFLEITLP